MQGSVSPLPLSKTFRSHGAFGARRNAEAVVAADDVSFTVAEGEIVALVGESGSGKTTAAKMAMGLVRPDFWNGRDCARGTRAVGQGRRPTGISASKGLA